MRVLTHPSVVLVNCSPRSLALTTFLAALDSTAVATSLSTIQRELDGTAASLSLVTGAYLLCITALAPCYGKLSDYYGRKWVLYVSIVIFMIVRLRSSLRHAS